jgi:hypothetical protein
MTDYPRDLPPQLLGLLKAQPAAVEFEADTQAEAEQLALDLRSEMKATAWRLEAIFDDRIPHRLTDSAE